MSVAMRYFRIDPEAYATAAATLDGLFGHPNGKAETCLPPDPAMDSEGRVLVAARTEFLDWSEVAPLVADLIASGEAVEISAEDYAAASPQPQENL